MSKINRAVFCQWSLLNIVFVRLQLVLETKHFSALPESSTSEMQNVKYILISEMPKEIFCFHIFKENCNERNTNSFMSDIELPF